MFRLFKKKPNPELKPGIEAHFEILLPKALTQGAMPDLRIGSKALDILRASPNDVQTLEIFGGLPVVNSNNPQLKAFATLVNNSKQTTALKEQISLMSFSPQSPGSLGVLCCLIAGALHEFHITNRGGGATLNYQFTRVVRTDNRLNVSPRSSA